MFFDKRDFCFMSNIAITCVTELESCKQPDEDKTLSGSLVLDLRI